MDGFRLVFLQSFLVLYQNDLYKTPNSHLPLVRRMELQPNLYFRSFSNLSKSVSSTVNEKQYSDEYL